MERFWPYVTSLRWVPLHEPGPLQALVRGVARHLDDTRDDITWLRNQFVVRTTDNDLLDSYATSRTVIRSYYDTDLQWRSRVEQAFKWFKRGGREQGLIAILADYGVPGAEVFNRRDEDEARWAEFFLRVPLPELTLIKQVYDLALQYKPARSRMTKFHVTTPQPSTAYCAAGVGYGLNVDLTCDSGV